RALIAQLATFHSPHDLRIGVVREQRLRDRWEWLKWLPHNTFEDAKDGPLPARFVSLNTAQAAELLSEELEHPTVDLPRPRDAPPGPSPGLSRSVQTVPAAGLLSEEIEPRTVDLQRRRGERPGPGTQRRVLFLDGEHQSTLSGLEAEPPVASLADLGIHVI